MWLFLWSVKICIKKNIFILQQISENEIVSKSSQTIVNIVII